MEIPYQTIERVLNGTASQKERERIAVWRSASAQNELIFQTLKNERLFTKNIKHTPVIPDKEKVWNRIMQQTTLKKSIRTYSLKELLAVAAMVAVLFMAGGYAVSLIDFGKANAQVTYTTISAPEGQKSKAVLPDGTEVWLNSGASISYSNLFAAENRDISMSGEAYFDVAANKEVPFNLNIQNEISLTVLGTSFNVKSNHQRIEVALNEGSVQLINRQDNEDLVKLKPLEKAVIEKKKGTLFCNVMAMDEFYDNLWSLQELKIENASFADIVEKLEKRYGVQIEFSNINPQKRYWISIHNETLNETLNVLGKIVPITYTVNNNNVTIIGK